MKRDLSLKQFPQDYVVFDIETTGFSPQNDEIIELSAIKVKDCEIVDEFSKLIKPFGFLSSRITDLTGITKEMVVSAPYINPVILEFKEFCKDFIVLGHNVTFDLGFINAKLFECHKMTFDNDYIDTLKLARKYLSHLSSKKLGVIAEHFGLNTDGMHRGLKDCSVTNVCYQKLCELAEQKGDYKPLKHKPLSLFDVLK